MNRPSIAIVLETSNADQLPPGLRREWLIRRVATLREQGDAMGGVELVITYRGERPEALEAPGVKLVSIPTPTGYYEEKNIGFTETTADLVVFADSDCSPAPRWLERITEPLRRGDAEVVAGRTVYTPGILGDGATAVDFPLVGNPGDDDAVRNFYANNVAFARETFATRGFPRRSWLRGQCGALACQLYVEGVRVHYQPDAHVIHPMPSGLVQWVRQRMRRGADLSALAPEIAASHFGTGRLARVAALSPAATVLAGRTLLGVHSVGRSRAPILDRLASTGVVAALSALDTVGALASRVRR